MRTFLTRRVPVLLLTVLLLLALPSCSGDLRPVDVPEIGLRAYLPPGWSWEVQTGYRPGLRLWPDDDPTAEVELIRWRWDAKPSDEPGVFHGRINTSAGELLERYWEERGEEVRVYLCWPNRGLYRLTGALTPDQWERYRADLLRIADTVTFPSPP